MTWKMIQIWPKGPLKSTSQIKKLGHGKSDHMEKLLRQILQEFFLSSHKKLMLPLVLWPPHLKLTSHNKKLDTANLTMWQNC